MQGGPAYNQYSYPQNFYGYPMYPMPMMPADMQVRKRNLIVVFNSFK